MTITFAELGNDRLFYQPDGEGFKADLMGAIVMRKLGKGLAYDTHTKQRHQLTSDTKVIPWNAVHESNY